VIRVLHEHADERGIGTSRQPGASPERDATPPGKPGIWPHRALPGNLTLMRPNPTAVQSNVGADPRFSGPADRNTPWLGQPRIFSHRDFLVTGMTHLIGGRIDGSRPFLRKTTYAAQYMDRQTSQPTDSTGRGFATRGSHIGQAASSLLTAGPAPKGMGPVNRTEHVHSVQVAGNHAGEERTSAGEFTLPEAISQIPSAGYLARDFTMPALHYVKPAASVAGASYVPDEGSPSNRELAGFGTRAARRTSIEQEMPTKANGRNMTEHTLNHLTSRVYQMLERKIQIERERKGLHG
jgi:hypothetical protein